MAVELDHHVAFAQTCLSRGTAGRDRNHQHSARCGQAIVPDQPTMERNILAADADVAAADFAFFNQPASDEFGGIYADGEAKALRGQNDSGVDANDIALRVDERAAGISRV